MVDVNNLILQLQLFFDKHKTEIIIGIISVISIIVICLRGKKVNTRDIDNKVTVCVKTLYRSKAIGKFVKDTRKLFPTITIIISDDSDDEYKIINKQTIENVSPNDPNIIYIPLPYDSGVSKGRNECVKRVKTPYTIITDDTRTINDADSVYKLVDYLDNNKQYDIITGFVPERRGVHQAYTKLFKSVSINDKIIDSKSEVLKLIGDLNNKIQIKEEKINEINNDGYSITDIGVNCFISRTNILSKYPWNDTLKIVEHTYFFLILWCNNIKILYDKNFIFHQMKGEYRIYDKNGQSLRGRKFYGDLF